MRKLLTKILKAPVYAYRWCVSPLLGPRCRYVPTCSEYALEALDRHGPAGGTWLALKRLLKCHPWCKCARHDPVPGEFEWFARGPFMGYKRHN